MIPKKLFSNILIIVTIFNISMASVFHNIYFTFTLGVLLAIFFSGTNLQIDRKFYFLLVIWLFINLISSIVTQIDFKITRFIFNTFSILVFPYYLLKLIGPDFWKKFEKIVYFLTYISIPIFVLNFLFQDEFNALSKYFKPFTNEIFYIIGNKDSYWSAFIYTNGIYDTTSELFRNAGFMWEPGAFALLIIWALIYNWTKLGVKFNNKSFVYIIALLTTTSTAGYLAFLIMLIGNSINKITISNTLGFLTILITTIILFNSIYFLGPKIAEYTTSFVIEEQIFDDNFNAIRVNRFQKMELDFIKCLKNPTGYGLIGDEDINKNMVFSGVNGVSGILVIWGFPMFVIFIIYMFKYVKYLDSSSKSKVKNFLYLFALLIMIFSNPVEQNIFIYFIVLTPLLPEFSIKPYH